jgi:hypothetical protein
MLLLLFDCNRVPKAATMVTIDNTKYKPKTTAIIETLDTIVFLDAFTVKRIDIII